MSRDKLRLNDYLEHILEAIARIERYIDGLNEPAFHADELVQDAVIRNIEIIGEASRNILKHFPETVSKYPGIPFSYAYQMRNAVSHGYFTVDLELVWRTVHTELPTMRTQIRMVADSTRVNENR